MFGKAVPIPVDTKCAFCGGIFKTLRVREVNYCRPSHRTMAWRERIRDRGLDPDYDCDERCADAEGPICYCKCGGVNHGKARKGDVLN